MLPLRKVARRALLLLPGFEALCRRLTPRHVRVLMYHRFRPDDVDDPRALGASALRAQLRLIRRNHPLWTADRQGAALRDGWPAGVRAPVVITVDDGYADFRAVAFPALREAGAPATLFVTTGFVDGRTWLWWDRLRHALETAAPGRYALSGGAGALDLDLRDGPGRERAWNALADHCRFRPETECGAIIAAAAAAVGVALPPLPPPAYAAVSWDDLREMSSLGIACGGHTDTHPILTRIGPDEVRHELTACRDRLAAELGSPPRWFAYPQGGPADYDEGVARLVAEAGFAGAYVSHPAWDGEGGPFTLTRYSVGADVWDLRWYLCGAEYLWLGLRRRAGRPAGAPASYWAGST